MKCPKCNNNMYLLLNLYHCPICEGENSVEEKPSVKFGVGTKDDIWSYSINVGGVKFYYDENYSFIVPFQYECLNGKHARVNVDWVEALAKWIKHPANDSLCPGNIKYSNGNYHFTNLIEYHRGNYRLVKDLKANYNDRPMTSAYWVFIQKEMEQIVNFWSQYFDRYNLIKST